MTNQQEGLYEEQERSPVVDASVAGVFAAVVWLKARLKWSLIAAVLLLLLVWLGAMALKPPMVTTSAQIGFTFPQAETGSYPNGGAFSITDIVSRPVLEAVWSKNKLSDQGVGLEELIGSVSIVPPSNFVTQAKYQALLGRKGITPAEVAVADKEYRTELEAQARKSATITLTGPLLFGLSGSQRAKILQDIPTEWSNQAITKLGVLSIPISEKDTIKKDVVEKGSVNQIVGYFYQSHDAMRNSIEQVKKFPGGESLRDPQSGVGLSDLSRQLDDVERYWIADLDGIVQSGVEIGVADIVSMENRLTELKQLRSSLLADSLGYRAALQDYDAPRRSSAQNTSEADSAGRNKVDAGQIALQGDALQKLIDLGAQQKDVEFRQVLTNKRIAAELQARAMDQESNRMERRLAGSKKPKSGSLDAEKRNYYVSQIMTRLTGISDSLSRIQEAQRSRFMNAKGALYEGPIVSSNARGALIGSLQVPVIGLALLTLAALLILALAKLAQFNRALTKPA